MRNTFFSVLAGMSLIATIALAQSLTKFYPSGAVTVSSHTVTLIFAANWEDRNRIIYPATYDIVTASTTAGVSCTSNFPIKKGVYFSFPKNATYAVYGLSCGAGDTTVFKAKDK